MRRLCTLFVLAIAWLSWGEDRTEKLKLLLLQSVEANQSMDQTIQSAFSEMALGRINKRQAEYLFLNLKEDSRAMIDTLQGLSIEPEWSQVKAGNVVLALWDEQSNRLDSLVRACGIEADSGAAKAKPLWEIYRAHLKRYGAVKTKAYSLWYRGGEDPPDPSSSPSPWPPVFETKLP